jgi:hypothetical protein
MNTNTTTNLWLEILRTDVVKYIIVAILIVGLYFFFKKELKKNRNPTT